MTLRQFWQIFCFNFGAGFGPPLKDIPDGQSDPDFLYPPGSIPGESQGRPDCDNAESGLPPNGCSFDKSFRLHDLFKKIQRILGQKTFQIIPVIALHSLLHIRGRIDGDQKKIPKPLFPIAKGLHLLQHFFDIRSRTQRINAGISSK